MTPSIIRRRSFGQRLARLPGLMRHSWQFCRNAAFTERVLFCMWVARLQLFPLCSPPPSKN
jgi:hypothetical protein